MCSLRIDSSLRKTSSAEAVSEKSSFGDKLVKWGLLTAAAIVGVCAAVHFSAVSKENIESTLVQLDKIAKTKVDICQDDSLKATVCLENLGVPRSQMPQVQGHVLESYLDMQQAGGVDVSYVFMSPKDLRPIQKEMHAGKVAGIIRSAITGVVDACKSQPILVAIQRIIDGHHRYAACSLLGKDLSVIRIDKNITTVLEELRTFPGVTYESL